jgi:hypothetical protein
MKLRLGNVLPGRTLLPGIKKTLISLFSLPVRHTDHRRLVRLIYYAFYMARGGWNANFAIDVPGADLKISAISNVQLWLTVLCITGYECPGLLPNCSG